MDKPIESVRATLKELWTRLVYAEKSDLIYVNGHNNLYPNEMERVIRNSPTANRSAMMLAKFITGQGIEGDDVIINKRDRKFLSDIVKDMASSISYQNGFYLHLGYGINEQGVYIPNRLEVLDYIRCRISKEDDNDYPNKVFFSDWESGKEGAASRTTAAIRSASSSRKNKSKKKNSVNTKWYYPFNDSQEIIKAQIAEDGRNHITAEDKLKAYRGQVLYVNLTPNFKYAISKFDSVYNDCDTEYRMGLYSNTMTRNGFLGKLAVITSGLTPKQGEEEAEKIQKWLGAEQSQSIYQMDVARVEDIDKVLKVIQVESQYDDDMFINLDKRVKRNITGQANNIPEDLIYSSNAVFDGGGDKYREMKAIYSEQTEEERLVIEKTLKLVGFDIKIISFEDAEKAQNPIIPSEKPPITHKLT